MNTYKKIIVTMITIGLSSSAQAMEADRDRACRTTLQCAGTCVALSVAGLVNNGGSCTTPALALAGCGQLQVPWVPCAYAALSVASVGLLSIATAQPTPAAPLRR